MSDTYLPYRLSSQGWLTDMLLGQIYSPSHDAIRKMIYSRDFISETKNKLFSLHPSHKNYLETEFLPKLSNNPSAWDRLGDVAGDVLEKCHSCTNSIDDAIHKNIYQEQNIVWLMENKGCCF